MNTLNKTLCKTTDFVLGMTEFVGMTVGLIVKWAILSVFGIAAGASALLLWLSVPTALAVAICDKVPSQTQVFAMFGIFGVWAILSKIAYDRWDRRRKK